jgi:hypothetical protein
LKPDVTVVIVFHDEGVYALAALDSMMDNVRAARAEGLVVETRAILDRPSEQTRDLVRRSGRWLDSVDEVSFGDLGLTRNAAARSAKGEFLAFLDGDDLWGERWIVDAFRCASASAEDAIWHPQYVYFFDDNGYNHHSQTERPSPYCRAGYGIHLPSTATGFDPRSLIFANAWTANALTPRRIHIKFPYGPADVSRAVAFEDWGWNIKTLNSGIAHLVVESAVHAVRRRDPSLSTTMRAAGALPVY